MDEETEKQTNSRPWLYKKGQSGNPGGKKPGTISMKTYIRNKLLSMTEEEREVFLEGVDKKVLWEMAEGKPETKTEINATVEVKPITGMKIVKDSGDNIQD
jgi:hypothetical protein